MLEQQRLSDQPNENAKNENFTESLKCIDRNSIVEVKSLPKPPELVKLIFNCVMILFGKKEGWASCRNELSDVNRFIN